MKKKLSLLLVAFIALAAYAGLNAWRAASDEVVYTFTPQKPSSGAVSDYTKTGDQTIDGVTWDVPGNWYATGGLRLGGRSLDKVDRVITGKTAIDKAVGKLTFNHGGVTSDKLTLNSVTVTVASDADFNNVIESVTKSDMTIAKNTEGSFDIEPTSGEWPANSYYKFAFNISNSNSSNYAFVLKSIVFFGVGEQTEETKAVYLKPGVWNADGARFAAYLFKDGDVNTWVNFQSVVGSDGSTGTYFKADIPASYTGMILVRMNGETTENNWDNKWNQTDDIDISSLADNTLYRITGWGSGSNSPYDTTTWPEQSTDPDPQPEQVTWTVAGSSEALFGTAWDPTLEANDMTLEDGVYIWEKENVTLLPGDVEFKVVKNHDSNYAEAYPENNYVKNIEVGGFYTFTITFNAETNAINATAIKTGGIITTAELNALEDKTPFTYFGDAVVVAKPTAKYVYIADERGGSLIYDKNSVGTAAAEVGKTIATPWSGTVSIYNGLFEAIPTAALAVKDGDAVQVTYQEVDATYLSAYNVNKVVKMKGLTITAINNKNITFKQGDAEVAGYNQFGLQLSTEQVGKTYDVVGAIGRYNDNIQFQPISMEEVAAPVTINSMAIVGELTGGWPDTETGDWSMAKEMTKSADNANVWTLTVAEFEAEAKEYQYKATANGQYGVYELPSEGNKKYTFTEAGKYSLLFTADTEKHELTLEAKKIEEAGETKTVTFVNDKNWTKVYVWAWNDTENFTGGEWPGQEITPVEGVYTWSTTGTPTYIIFSDGGDNKTADLVFENGATYNSSGKVTDPENPEPATISKVQICGATDAAWTNRIDFELNSAAPEQPNTYYNVLDATAYTDDVEFKLVVNESEWLGIGRFEKIEDPEGLVDQTTNVGDGKSYNFILKNSNGKYQKYDFKASWKENPDAGAGWTLEVLGTEPRTAPAPELIVLGNNEAIFGKAWDTESTANTMELKDGKYYRTYTKVQPQETAIELKAYNKTNGKWFGNKKDDGNVKFNMKAEGDFTVVLDVNADFTAGNVEVTGDNVEMIYPEPEQPVEDATIEKVQLLGDWNWDAATDNITLTKGEGNVWTGVLDLTETVEDQKFKLVVNGGGDESDNWKGWIGTNNLTVNAPEGWAVSTADATNANCTLNNSKTGYKTYDITATWTPSADYAAGWTLTIAGKDERPVVTEPVYTLVGAFYDVEGKESASFFGESWKVLEANNLEKISDGFYKKDYTGINLEKGNVSLKVLKDGDWEHPYPNADGYLLEIPSAGVYDLMFTFHSDEGGVVRGMADKKSDPVEITRMDIVGDFTGGWPSKDETSGEWDWSKAKAMTQSAENPAIWTLTVEGFKAEAKTYEYKATANGQYGVYELPASGNNNWVFGTEAYPAGKYDLLFTANTADNSLTVVPTLTEVETVILDEEETLAENQVLEVEEPFTSDEITVEDGQIITIEADEAGESLVPRRAFRALAASDITIQYKPEAGSDWQDAPVTVETNETGYQFEVTVAVATAINDRGFAIKANKPIVVTQVAVVTEVTPDPEPEPVYYAVGVKALWGVNDWTVDEANKLTLNGEGKYTITKTELTLDANTNYGYKVVKKVGDTQYWIPDGMNNEKNLTVTERAVYSVTLTLDPAEPLTAESFNAVATKTGEAEPAADAEITKVEIRGSFNGWDTPADGLVMTKQGETNTYTATLDLTEITEDVQFKLVLNNKVDWLGWGELELVAPENWTAKEDGTGNNIVLKNASTGYKTYTLTATWTPGPVAKTGWKLEIVGKDERPAVPATITKVELRGEFTNWSDGEGVELTKQGETDTYAGVLDLSEITADQAFKLVINDKTYWIDFNHLSLVAPDGWLVKESGDVSEPAIILTNASTGYKTYNVTATWTPSPNAAAGWTLTIAGKDQRGDTPAEPVYYAVGVKALWGVNDWTVDEANKLTLNGEGKYTITKTELTLDANTNYGYKVVKKVGDTQYWIPDGMDNEKNLTVTERAVYSVTLTLDPAEPLTAESFTAVATKTGEAEPAADAEITKVEIRGEFTSWSDGEGVELTKQGETDTYAGVLDLSEITADQAFKLVINDKTYWLDFNHVELVAPDGWLVKESGDVSEPAIILTNASTGYKTYNVTATWTPSPNAAAGWTLTVAGKDLREPAPEANYYIVGSMTDWQTNEAYKLTLNEAAEAGIVEYKITLDLEANAEFKVVKVQGESQTWYPDGMDNNYKITTSSNYTVYFRPNGDGGDDWHYHYIYAQDNNPTGINGVKADALKDAEVYTINGQRVQNPTKGLYIVNGRKVVIK